MWVNHKEHQQFFSIFTESDMVDVVSALFRQPSQKSLKRAQKLELHPINHHHHHHHVSNVRATSVRTRPTSQQMQIVLGFL